MCVIMLMRSTHAIHAISDARRSGLDGAQRGQIAEAVRQAGIVEGGFVVAAPLLLLAGIATSPFDPPHDPAALPTAVFGVGEGPTDPAYTPHASFLVALQAAQVEGRGDRSDVYVLIGPSAWFRPGVGPKEMLLEYQRLRFAHTGSFEGPLAVALACPRQPQVG
jgi:hypothetical protein